MVKKTYRRFSKKGLSKKNKLRKSKRKSLRSKRKSRKYGGYELGFKLSCGMQFPGGGQDYIDCESEKAKKYESEGNEEKRQKHADKALREGYRNTASE